MRYPPRPPLRPRVDDSEAIDTIVTLLERQYGVRVHLHAFDLPCAGMYRSETGEVFVNAASARDALLAIAHEAGHVIGSRFWPKKHDYQRERQAFVYGWFVLWMIGSRVPRREWVDADRDRRRAPDVDTSHFRRSA